jgi:hypothetical protein
VAVLDIPEGDRHQFGPARQGRRRQDAARQRWIAEIQFGLQIMDADIFPASLVVRRMAMLRSSRTLPGNR